MSDVGTSNDGYAGQQDPSNSSSDFNVMSFLVRQMLGKVHTVTVAQVKAVTSHSEIEGAGFVDVLILVKMIDGAAQASPHVTMYGLPYFRLQSGANAIILDPKVGDIGLIAIAERDISAVKSTKKESNPGSFRRFDLADGIYLGGILNGTPTQYVRFVTDSNGAPTGMELIDINGNKIQMTSTGIKMTDNNSHIVEMKSTGIAITGDVTVTGKVTASDIGSFGGGSQFVKLADGSNATKLKAT